MTLATNLKRLGPIGLLLVIMLAPIHALCDKAVLDHNGVPGIWFDEATATRMLQDLTELNILKNKKIPSFEMAIDLQKMNAENYRLELEVTEKIALKWEESYSKSEAIRDAEYQRYQEELTNKSKWYKSPIFGFIIGVVSGGLLAVGLSFGLSNSNIAN